MISINDWLIFLFFQLIFGLGSTTNKQTFSVLKCKNELKTEFSFEEKNSRILIIIIIVLKIIFFLWFFIFIRWSIEWQFPNKNRIQSKNEKNWKIYWMKKQDRNEVMWLWKFLKISKKQKAKNKQSSLLLFDHYQN